MQAYKSVSNFKYEIRGHTRICSRHFVSTDYQYAGEGKMVLATTAIPSMFPDVECYEPPKRYYDPYVHDDDRSRDDNEVSSRGFLQCGK